MWFAKDRSCVGIKHVAVDDIIMTLCSFIILTI